MQDLRAKTLTGKDTLLREKTITQFQERLRVNQNVKPRT
jgi:hypothetical protein